VISPVLVAEDNWPVLKARAVDRNEVPQKRAFVQIPPNYTELPEAERLKLADQVAEDMQKRLGIKPR
jgi:hypothetical protein